MRAPVGGRSAQLSSCLETESEAKTEKYRVSRVDRDKVTERLRSWRDIRNSYQMPEMICLETRAETELLRQ